MISPLGIIAKSGDAQVKATLKTLLAYLQQRRVSFLCDATCADYLPALPIADSQEMGRRCQLVISVGGDGTLLHAARTFAPYDMPLLGINLGRLGFLADISPAELERHLAPILAGDFSEEPRFLLQAEAWRGEEQLAETHAFNDVVLHRWSTPSMFAFHTWIDGRFVSDQRADGLIVSTPTGSTAYGLSVGGPILHPGLQALLLISICPHSLSNRPIVVGADSRIEVSLTCKQAAAAQMTCDGIACQEILPGDKVLIRRHSQIRLVHPPGHDYYAILRAKLHWGRTP
jgi:NAD+ kinase